MRAIWKAAVFLMLVLVEQSSGKGQDSKNSAARPVMRGVPVSTLPDALLAHFANRGVVLRKQVSYGTKTTVWIVGNVQVGPQCEVLTRFVRFPREADIAAARNYLMGISLLSVLNEREKLAMFYPWAKAKTSNPKDCENWGPERARIEQKLVKAFESYVPPANRVQDKQE